MRWRYSRGGMVERLGSPLFAGMARSYRGASRAKGCGVFVEKGGLAWKAG